MGAPIREELVLADSFSQTFRNFDAAANAAINVAEEFQKTLNEFSQGFLDGLIEGLHDSRDQLGKMADEADDVKNAYVGVEDIIKKTTGNIKDNTNEQERFTKEVNNSEKAAGNLMGTISKIAGAIGVVKLTENFIETSDQLSQISAKLNMINDGSQTTAEFQNDIYESAQRARGSYLDTANLVARIGMNAADAFDSNSEILQFAENLNKSFIIAGASAQEQSSVILQLSQALGSGVLRGQEFNAVMAGAPNIMRTVADYMQIGVGELRAMAAEGQITAEVVKKAMLGATDRINKQFDQIPKTFSSIMTTAKNRLIEGMDDVFNEWSNKLNDAHVQDTIDGVTDAILELERAGGNALMDIADAIVKIRDNWDSISTVLEIAGGALLAYKVLNLDIAAAIQSAWAAVNWEIAGIATVISLVAVGTDKVIKGASGGDGNKKSVPYLDSPYYNQYAYRSSTGMGFGYGINGSGGADLTAAMQNYDKWKNDAVSTVLLNSFGYDLANEDFKKSFGMTYGEYMGYVYGLEKEWKEKSNWYQDYYTKEPDSSYAENQEAHKRKAEWYEVYYGAGVRLVQGEHIAQDSDWYAATYGYGNKIEETVEEIKDDGVKIKGEVKLSDEDLKIFRDIAENRYIANVSLETLAPSVSVNVENNGQNLSEDDIATAVTKALETQISEHTAISHG